MKDIQPKEFCGFIIPFFVKQGFDKYEKTIKNYFIDNYDEKIIDGDLQCVDMYYYSKDLKKINNKKGFFLK